MALSLAHLTPVWPSLQPLCETAQILKAHPHKWPSLLHRCLLPATLVELPLLLLRPAWRHHQAAWWNLHSFERTHQLLICAIPCVGLHVMSWSTAQHVTTSPQDARHARKQRGTEPSASRIIPISLSLSLSMSISLTHFPLLSLSLSCFSFFLSDFVSLSLSLSLPPVSLSLHRL